MVLQEGSWRVRGVTHSKGSASAALDFVTGVAQAGVPQPGGPPPGTFASLQAMSPQERAALPRQVPFRASAGPIKEDMPHATATLSLHAVAPNYRAARRGGRAAADHPLRHGGARREGARPALPRAPAAGASPPRQQRHRLRTELGRSASPPYGGRRFARGGARHAVAAGAVRVSSAHLDLAAEAGKQKLGDVELSWSARGGFGLLLAWRREFTLSAAGPADRLVAWQALAGKQPLAADVVGCPASKTAAVPAGATGYEVRVVEIEPVAVEFRLSDVRLPHRPPQQIEPLRYPKGKPPVSVERVEAMPPAVFVVLSNHTQKVAEEAVFRLRGLDGAGEAVADVRLTHLFIPALPAANPSQKKQVPRQVQLRPDWPAAVVRWGGHAGAPRVRRWHDLAVRGILTGGCRTGPRRPRRRRRRRRQQLGVEEGSRPVRLRHDLSRPEEDLAQPAPGRGSGGAAEDDPGRLPSQRPADHARHQPQQQAVQPHDDNRGGRRFRGGDRRLRLQHPGV